MRQRNWKLSLFYFLDLLMWQLTEGGKQTKKKKKKERDDVIFILLQQIIRNDLEQK